MNANIRDQDSLSNAKSNFTMSSQYMELNATWVSRFDPGTGKGHQ